MAWIRIEKPDVRIKILQVIQLGALIQGGVPSPKFTFGEISSLFATFPISYPKSPEPFGGIFNRNIYIFFPAGQRFLQ
jgi:hypothetical protein